MRKIQAAIPLLLVPPLVAVLFRKVLRLWWMYDDPFQLRMLRDVALGSLLTTKQFYGGASVFTPLLIVSLKLDSLLFGLQAPGFYAHQLVSLAAALLLEYCLLRLWCPPLPSLAAVVVTATGAPLLQIVPLLMCRHYIEGTILAVLATIAYVVTLRGRRWAVLSAAAYFLAACAKEIFVPLPLLLVVIPEGTLRTRLRALRGHAIAAVLYAVWRLMSVGFDVGSYGFLGSQESWKSIAALPWVVVRQLALPGGAVGWTAVACVAACAIIVFIRRPPARLPIAVALVITLLPLVPLAAAIERRYAFALWLCAAAAVAFLPRAIPPRAGAALAVVVAAVSLLAFRAAWPAVYRDLLRMSDETRVLSMLGPNDILRDPITPPTTMLEMVQLTGTPAHAYYDELRLCAPDAHLGRIFEYDAARREIRETGRAGLDRVCASIVEKPISVEIRFDREKALRWKLGPYTTGRWSFVIAEGLVAYDVAPEGGFRRPGWDQFRMRARYISPEGWRTYSP
ncbi:MAG TPA: hypothetical protein VG323_21280, partial [Thermoanaerobaculia bacterium]|nr:hypothetical protein [Thermoanaerobaculia bacterium]